MSYLAAYLQPPCDIQLQDTFKNTSSVQLSFALTWVAGARPISLHLRSKSGWALVGIWMRVPKAVQGCGVETGNDKPPLSVSALKTYRVTTSQLRLFGGKVPCISCGAYFPQLSKPNPSYFMIYILKAESQHSCKGYQKHFAHLKVWHRYFLGIVILLIAFWLRVCIGLWSLPLW